MTAVIPQVWDDSPVRPDLSSHLKQRYALRGLAGTTAGRDRGCGPPRHKMSQGSGGYLLQHGWKRKPKQPRPHAPNKLGQALVQTPHLHD